MGIETALIVAGGMAVAKGVMQVKAADAEKDALDLQAKQQQLKHAQQTLSNYDLLEKVLDKQTAQATTRGIALSSPSLDAIRRNTINTAVKTQNNLDIENDFVQQNIKTEKRNVNNRLFAQLFGDAAEGASSFASMNGKMPTRG